MTAFLAMLLLVACDGAPPRSTSPAEQGTRDPGVIVPGTIRPLTSTPIPIDHTDYGLPVWETPPKTGVAHVDAIIAAIANADAEALRPYVTGELGRCDHRNSDRYCLPNTPDGTITRYVAAFACDGRWGPVAADGTPGAQTVATIAREVSQAGRVVAAWARRPGDLDSRRYEVALTRFPRLTSASGAGGTVVEIDDQGIIGVGRALACSRSQDYVDRMAKTHDVIIPVASER
ncbi:MAG: hypothetical protein WCI61_10980 [Chloroflexota bacterium]